MKKNTVRVLICGMLFLAAFYMLFHFFLLYFFDISYTWQWQFGIYTALIIVAQAVLLFFIFWNAMKGKRTKQLLDGQNRILEMVAKGSPLPQILDSITEVIGRQAGAICSILLYDQEANKLLFGSAPQLPEEYNQKINGLPIGLNIGSCGTAAFCKELVVVSDIANDPRWADFKDLALQFNLRACWSLPIMSNNRLVGTFGMYYRAPRSPDTEEIELLEKAGYLVRLAIERSETEETVHNLAFYDALTSLPNRAKFHITFKHMVEQAQEHHEPIAVLFIDLDRFKAINDTLGHIAGDELLKQAASRIKKCVGDEDFLARLGGDEFVVLLKNCTVDEARYTAKNMITELSAPFLLLGHEYMISTSIGISMFPEHGDDRNALIRNADTAMMHAKKKLDKNSFQLYHQRLNETSAEELEIEMHLKKAIVRNELFLHYQPLVDTHSGAIIGVEALLRWFQQKQSLVPPTKFIPVAEKTGFIVPLGEWVLREACYQCMQWHELGYTSLKISVNLSAFQFQRSNIVEMVRNVLHETALEAQYLQLEITESMMMDEEIAKEVLNNLKEIGVHIAIDDFGTGYSSFSVLSGLPIDHLKIDKSFLADLNHNGDIIKSIIAMAHSLKMKVTAEGVETEEQLSFLKEVNCDLVQGYYLSKPLHSDNMNELLASMNNRN